MTGFDVPDNLLGNPEKLVGKKNAVGAKVNLQTQRANTRFKRLLADLTLQSTKVVT